MTHNDFSVNKSVFNDSRVRLCEPGQEVGVTHLAELATLEYWGFW